VVAELGRDLKSGGEMQHHFADYNIHEGHNLGEIFGDQEARRVASARKLEREREGGNQNHGEFKRTTPKPSAETRSHIRRMEREDRASRREEDDRVRRYNKEETQIGEVFGLSKKEKSAAAAKKMMSSGPWKRADAAMKATSWNRYWGPDAKPKLQVNSQFLDIFDSLTEENKLALVEHIKENGFEEVTRVFGIDWSKD